MTSEVFVWIANNGLAVVIVVAAGVGVWRLCGWFGTNVITPGRDAFIQHLHSIGTFMTATTKSLESTAKSIDVISEQMRGIREDVDAISKRVEDR